MEVAAAHLDGTTLEAGLANLLNSPKDCGALVAVFARPSTNQRLRLNTAELSIEGGLPGDRWASDHWQKLPGGAPDPRSQLSLMNVRVARLLAGGDEAIHLAGDNLMIDLDLSEHNLPAGSLLRIGNEVVLELTDQPHQGCGKFARRYGVAARNFVNEQNSLGLNLRGRYARVLHGGTIREGDEVRKAPAGQGTTQSAP